MILEVPLLIKTCLNTLKSNNYEAYIVGGAVRDALLGQKTYDWDIASNASPDTLSQIFPKGVFKNKKFGTISLFEASLSIEITPYRVESNYKNHRHPQNIDFSQNLQDDLQRRDFTINAMAYDVFSDSLIDPFEGQRDLKKKVLKTVGSAKQRLNEDYLRILRAARFANRLNLKISEDIVETSSFLAKEIINISHERIGAELFKIFQHKSCLIALQFLKKTGLDAYIFLNTLTEDLNCFDNKLPNEYKALCRLLRAVNLSFEDAHTLLLNWSWDKTYQKQLKHIQTCLDFYQQSKHNISAKHDFLLNIANPDLNEWQKIYAFLNNSSNEAAYILELNQFKANSALIALKDLAISGKDIQTILNDSGKNRLISQILDDLLENVRLNQLSNTQKALSAHVKQKYTDSY